MESRRRPVLTRQPPYRYYTFATEPPKSKGQSQAHNSQPNKQSPSKNQSQSQDANRPASPLPKKQLIVLALIALAEQTALNSISPYLPDMASTFPEVKPGRVGLNVGIIASAFALAQFATNFFWGWLSDKIGRKPVILMGTLMTATCFVAFGFCKTLWQAIVVQALMGLVNGNQGIVSTCLGEITDRSNQSKAFQYLPVIYGIGGISGPILGGLLVSKKSLFNQSEPNQYPYLLPNLVSACFLIIDFWVAALYLEESLEGAKTLPPLRRRISCLFVWLWQFTSSSRPSYIDRPVHSVHDRIHDYITGEYTSLSSADELTDDNSLDSESISSTTQLLPRSPEQHLTRNQVLNRDTILLLLSYLIFHLSNVSYNSLYPIFAQAPPPTGRGLFPSEIGVSLAFAGLVTILFQVGLFGRLRSRLGNKVTYRAGLAGFVVAYMLMPWIGYKESNSGPAAISVGRYWLWVELGFILLIKTVSAVGSLASALLLITNSVSDHAVLGTLNGLAQTLSAAGRAAGPFLSGGLFTLATKAQPKGEALAFGVFGGIACVGFLITFGIHGQQLEANFDESGPNSSDEDNETDNDS